MTTNRGTLLAVCDARIHRYGDPPNAIDQVLKRSFDNGRIWEPIKVIADYPDMASACDPCLLVDRHTGRNLGFHMYCPNGIGTREAQPGLTGRTTFLHTRWSDDDGQSWSAPRDLNREVKPPTWRVFYQGPGRGIQMRDGRLVVPCTGNEIQKQTSHIVYSEDHGKTWLRGSSPSGFLTNESQIVELTDGSLMMNMRSVHGLYQRAVAVTKDLGCSWTPLAHDSTLVEPICQASIIRYTDRRDGYTKDRLLFSNPANKDRRRIKMTVRISYDEGKTWPVKKLIDSGKTAYSCLTVLSDGTIGLLYERGEQHAAQRIAFARFNLEWLSEGKDELKKMLP